MALINLLYVSSACNELGTEELTRILESSVRHNMRQHVTGMLLYLNGSFMQVLEGEETAVDETYARIRQDPRHTGLSLIDHEQIRERSFANWSMGFRSLEVTDLANNAAYSPFFKSGFDASAMGAKEGLAHVMLKDFARHQGR